MAITSIYETLVGAYTTFSKMVLVALRALRVDLEIIRLLTITQILLIIEVPFPLVVILILLIVALIRPFFVIFFLFFLVSKNFSFPS